VKALAISLVRRAALCASCPRGIDHAHEQSRGPASDLALGQSVRLSPPASVPLHNYYSAPYYGYGGYGYGGLPLWTKAHTAMDPGL